MRDLTAAFESELDAVAKMPILLFEAEFASGVVNLWTGIGDISWDGKIWKGAAQVAGLSPIKETTEPKAVGMRATLSGIPPELLALALNETRRGLPCRVYLGFLDEAFQVIANPYKSFEGRLDQTEIDNDPDNPTISVNYENRLIDLERPSENRYTDQEQKRYHPDDKGFEFVPAVQDWSNKWGQK